MLTKRRTRPSSSQRRSLMPLNRRSRSLTTAPTVAPAAPTSSAPPVKRRSGVGMRTRTGIADPPERWCRSLVPCRAAGLRRERVVEGVELLQSSVDDERAGDAGADRFQRLVAVAGDADHDRLMARNALLV